MVNAAATAVFWTSAACMVGAGGAPHELINIAMTTAVRMVKRFIVFEGLLMNLAIGVTTTQRGDAVIFYNDFPIAFCNVEASKCLEILFAGDEGSRAILSDWA
jgi:hypothetical protein